MSILLKIRRHYIYVFGKKSKGLFSLYLCNICVKYMFFPEITSFNKYVKYMFFTKKTHVKTVFSDKSGSLTQHQFDTRLIMY